MLTLEIHGEKISGNHFIDATKAFLKIIEEVANETSHQSDTVETVVSVSKGSACLHVKLMPKKHTTASTEEIEQYVFRGLSQIERIAEQPAKFNHKALTKVAALTALVCSKQSRSALYPIDHLVVVSGSDQLKLTSQSANAVKGLLDRDYQDYGSIEGYLNGINTNKKPIISIYERLNHKRIECQIGEDLLSQALDYFEKRIEVYGLIKYRYDGEPISIQADELELLESDHPPPSADDILGLFEELL